MNCSNCGESLRNKSNFCSRCGEKIKNHQTSNELILKIKPNFIPVLSLVRVIPIQVFFTIWSALFFGNISIIALKAIHVEIINIYIYCFYGGLTFLGLPLVTYVNKKNSYLKTEYLFYKDHLEYYEGFFTLEKKTIKYEKVIEVSLKRGILQKQYNLGTIVLSIPTTNIRNGRTNSGIKVLDIKDSEKIYEKVIEIIG